jgi:hypothetical protein
MIEDRPHRLGLIYINQPLYFATFATRDRKSIPSVSRASLLFSNTLIARLLNLMLRLGDT